MVVFFKKIDLVLVILIILLSLLCYLKNKVKLQIFYFNGCVAQICFQVFQPAQ